MTAACLLAVSRRDDEARELRAVCGISLERRAREYRVIAGEHIVAAVVHVASELRYTQGVYRRSSGHESRISHLGEYLA